jgi:hypothetical protein
LEEGGISTDENGKALHTKCYVNEIIENRKKNESANSKEWLLGRRNLTLSVNFCQAGCEYGSVRKQDTDVAPAVLGLRVFLSILALLVCSESMTPNSKASPA